MMIQGFTVKLLIEDLFNIEEAAPASDKDAGTELKSH